MADNVTLPGTGALIATDDDGTAQHQYVKLEFGPDNTQTKVSTSNPLPVQPRNSAGTEATVIDNAAFTDGTTPVTPAGFIFDETPGTGLTENDTAAARVDSKRAQVVALEDATTRGQRLAVSAAGAASVAIPDLTTSGSLTSTTSVTLALAGQAQVAVQITGTWSATLQFEASVDGTNFFAVPAIVPSSAAVVTSAAANGQWLIPCGGYKQVRVRCSAFTSGTVVVSIQGSNGSQVALAYSSSSNPLPVTVVSGGDGSVQGLDAHDAPLTGDPVLTGARASASVPTNVSADNDAVELWALRSGALCTQPTASGTLIAAGNGTNGAALRVTVASDSTGVLAVTDNAGSLTTDTAGQVAHDGVGTGVSPCLFGGYASAAAPTDVSTDGDATRAWLLRNGAQCVNITAAGTLIASGNGTAATSLRVTLASDSTGIVGATCTGGAAHGTSVSGNPMLNGLEARTAVGAAVTNGQAVRALGDVFGKQVVITGALHEEQLGPASVNFTNTTAADLIATQGAGIKIAVTAITVTNAHATVGTKVTIRDKTTTTRKFVVYAAAAGGGCSLAGARPLLISDANSAIEAVCGTTGSDVDVSISGYLIKN